MSRANLEKLQDVLSNGWDKAANFVKEKKAKAAVVLGASAMLLTGCAVDASPAPTDTPIVVETEIPSETCADFSARMQETLPQLGSAEWLEKKAELEMEVIPGETSSQTIARFGTDGIPMVYDSLIDYLPTDHNTLADCLEQVGGEKDANFTTVLGLESVVDMSLSAILADNEELQPFKEDLKHNASIFTAQAARAVILGGTANGVETTVTTSQDDSSDSVIVGKYTYSYKSGGVESTGESGVYLETKPATDGDGEVLVMTHKAPYGG